MLRDAGRDRQHVEVEDDLLVAEAQPAQQIERARADLHASIDVDRLPSGNTLIANYNMDIGDFWEWSDTAFYPIPLTQKGFRLGVNYVTYGLTH